jgi:hypothetical protein
LGPRQIRRTSVTAPSHELADGGAVAIDHGALLTITGIAVAIAMRRTKDVTTCTE